MRFNQVLAAVLLVTSGCSYTFTIGPRERSLGGTPTTCTTSRVPPAIDTVIAVTSAIAAAAAIYACQSSENDNDDASCVRAILMVPPAVVTSVIFGMSARSGFRDSAGCEEESAGDVGSVP